MDIEDAANKIGNDIFRELGVSSEQITGSEQPSPVPSPVVADPSNQAPASSNVPAADPSLVPPQPAADPNAPEAPAAATPPEVPGKKLPPQTWKPDAAALWDNLPPRIQDEVLKREEDIFRGIEGYKQDAAIGKEIKTVVAPYMDYFQRFGVDPGQHIGTLLGMHQLLLNGSPQQKQELLQGLVQQFGIQLSQQNAPDFIDPELDNMRRELATLRSQQEAILRQGQQAQAQEVMQKVEQFATDPSKPYFSELINDITQLINGKVCRTLEEAYDRAVWLNPVTRVKEQTRLQQEALSRQQQDQATRAAEAARANSVNVQTSGRTGSETAPVGTMDDTLEETLQRIKSNGLR